MPLLTWRHLCYKRHLPCFNWLTADAIAHNFTHHDHILYFEPLPLPAEQVSLKSCFMKITLTFLCLLLPLGHYLDAQCYNLVWADEFDGTAIDNTKWSFQTGAGGWGNNEWQYYTDRNATVADGSLRIIARQESYLGADYTSARMRSINQGDWTYGKMEASIKLPQGKGIWPAFWMMPTNSVYGGWPRSGEIDIMEYLGHQTSIVYGTCHYGNSYLDKGQTSGSVNISPASFADGAFHTFAVEWEPSQIRWYVDGTHYLTYYAGDEGAYIFPFDQDFHFIFNLAVGGSWPGYPDGTTVFPQTLEVDYVRTYQLLSTLAIAGETLVDPQATGTAYAVPPIAGTTYAWTVPTGATISSGDGTPTITVDWGTTSGEVAVVLTNACGTRTLNLPVSVTANLAPNPGFEEDFSQWFMDLFDGAAANWAISTTEVHSGNKAMCVDVTNLGPQPWNIQLSPRSVELVSGESYTLQFWARADANNKTMSMAIINAGDFAYYTGNGYTLTDTWALYTHTFTAPATATSDVNLQFGHELGTYCLDDYLFARTAALPLTLVYFRGTARDKNNYLTWQTAREIDFSHFEVERSLDGVHFAKTGTVPGGNSINGAYQFVDDRPLSHNYYRLRQVDRDGTFDYSTMIFLENKRQAAIGISPTPATDFIQLTNVTPEEEIVVYNVNGQVVNVTYTRNAQGVELAVSQLRSGIYFVKIGGQTLKFVRG
ncbi:MAG: hypothetical protein C7N36_05380 [Bacteroidetes bacterium]|nr:MAG: hypothetical protein C7N36_05380 [Bacteroidota bacterium]